MSGTNNIKIIKKIINFYSNKNVFEVSMIYVSKYFRNKYYVLTTIITIISLDKFHNFWFGQISYDTINNFRKYIFVILEISYQQYPLAAFQI